MTEEPPQRILFFDGVCGLCNRAVDRLLRIDRKKKLLHFAPLQGETAHKLLPAGMADAMATAVYLRDGKLLLGSDASMQVMIDFGGWRKLYRLLRVIPRSWHEALYHWVARNRYRWFGRHDVCRLPTPEERERFLP